LGSIGDPSVSRAYLWVQTPPENKGTAVGQTASSRTKASIKPRCSTKKGPTGRKKKTGGKGEGQSKTVGSAGEKPTQKVR